MGTNRQWTIVWQDEGERMVVQATPEDGWTRHRFTSSLPADGAVLVLRDADRTLFIRAERPAVDRTLWELPRGQGEADDRDAVATAARELLEETGWTFRTGRDLGVVYPDSGLCGDHVHVVASDEPVAPTDAAAAAAEYADLRWLTDGQVAELVRTGEIRDGISLSALALAAAGR